MIDEKKLIKDILQHKDVLKDANYVYKNGYETRQKEIIDIIERQPPVEAVPVVRCKECKHWHKDIGWCDKHSHFINSDGSFYHPWESNDWKMFNENDFCSDGERIKGWNSFRSRILGGSSE